MPDKRGEPPPRQRDRANDVVGRETDQPRKVETLREQSDSDRDAREEINFHGSER